MSLKYTLGILSYLISLLISAHAIAEDRALIVGINTYTPPSELDGCKTDAKNMYHFIQKAWNYKPKQIQVLTDTAATRKTILAAFDNWLIKDSVPGDRVLFYYSGHGYHLPDDNGDETDGQDEVLCPVDSTRKSSNMIRDDEINARLRKLAGRQVIFISDSCHSGTITRAFGNEKRGPKPKQLFFSNEPPRPLARSIGRPEPENVFVEQLDNVITYSAVSPSQVALDGGTRGGIFTNAFIKAIEGKAADSNRDGIVTHAEVLNYVRKESQAFCDSTGGCDRNGGRLTPQLDANPKWRFVDVTAKEAIPPSPTESSSHTNAIAEVIAENNNTARLRTQMLPNTSFRLGESMQIKISSQRQGFLFVLDIDSAGKLTVLFPNEYSRKQNQRGILPAGRSITIPDASYGFSFEAQEPTGRGLLLTLLIEEDESFVQDFYHKLQSATRGFAVVDGFGTIKRTSQVQETLQHLHQQLHQTLLGTEGVGRPIRWSMAEMDYEIKR